jgi:hypothetical protein
MNRQPLTPLLAILTISSLGIGMIFVGQVLTQHDLYFVDKFDLGLDYRDFYRASRRFRNGSSPYDIVRYVTPPLAAILDVPATFLPFETMRYVVSVATFAAVLASLFVLQQLLVKRTARDDLLFMTLIAAVVMLSYPFYFLFDRGNIDGFVLLTMCLAIMALGRADGFAGVLFAIAVGLKAYPALVVLPLAAKRRWTALAFMCLTLVIFVLLTPDHWWRFVQSRLMERAGRFRIDENGSLAATFFYIGGWLSGQPPQSRSYLAELFARFSMPVYLALLAVVALRDARLGPSASLEELRGTVITYFPFMVAVPQLVYHYEFVNLLAIIPLVSWAWIGASTAGHRRVLLMMTVGIGLSQFHAAAAGRVTGTVYPHFVPGLGLLVVLVTIVIAKCSGAFLVPDSRPPQPRCAS